MSILKNQKILNLGVFVFAASLAGLVACSNEESKPVVIEASPSSADNPLLDPGMREEDYPNAIVIDPPSVKEMIKFMQSPETNRFAIKGSSELQAIPNAVEPNSKGLIGLNFTGMGLASYDNTSYDDLIKKGYDDEKVIAFYQKNPANKIHNILSRSLKRYSQEDRFNWELFKAAYLRGRLSQSQGGNDLSQLAAADAAYDAESSFFEDFNSLYPDKNILALSKQEISELFYNYLDYFTPATEK